MRKKGEYFAFKVRTKENKLLTKLLTKNLVISKLIKKNNKLKRNVSNMTNSICKHKLKRKVIP